MDNVVAAGTEMGGLILESGVFSGERIAASGSVNPIATNATTITDHGVAASRFSAGFSNATSLSSRCDG